jgi:hypothetical protein
MNKTEVMAFTVCVHVIAENCKFSHIKYLGKDILRKKLLYKW